MAIAATADVRTVETPHGRVRVRDTGGHGTPVLLVHSLLADPDLYAAVVPLLTAQGHRCLLPELPLGGHLVPMRDGADLTPTGLAVLLVEVLDALRVDRAHVVGVDTGGALTQLLMAAAPERVERVVLTACDAYEDFPPRSFAFLVKPLGNPALLRVIAGLAARSRLVRKAGVPKFVSHRGVDDATLVRWTAPLRDRDVRRDLVAVMRAMDGSYTLAAAETNRSFPRPVLIAWGDDSRAFPSSLADRLERDLPDTRRVTIADCAAFAAIDQPVRLAALVHEHLAA